jgi:hypothetical protein
LRNLVGNSKLKRKKDPKEISNTPKFKSPKQAANRAYPYSPAPAPTPYRSLPPIEIVPETFKIKHRGNYCFTSPSTFFKSPFKWF